MARKKVFIYGGCTSRDAVDFYPEYGLELLGYVARQSLVSAFRPADHSEFAIDNNLGTFQRRMLEGDILGNLPKLLNQHASEIDLFVWDLMIERVGVAKVRSGGMVTRNGVAKKLGAAPNGGAYIFGTPEHLRQWEWALDKFIARVEALGLMNKVVINATPWAIADKTGAEFVSKSDMKPDWFNPAIEAYWELAKSRGIKVARVPQEKAIADPDHKWGPAYFHYVPETYKAQLEVITGLV